MNCKMLIIDVSWQIFEKCLFYLYVFACTNSSCRSSHQRCSVKKVVLRNFPKFTGKHLCQSLFLIKLQAALATLLKKRLWYMCFSVNFAKSIRTLFSQSTSGRLLLKLRNSLRRQQVLVNMDQPAYTNK